jgi:hypothetical protein
MHLEKPTLFSLMNESETGLTYLNSIKEDDSLHVMRYDTCIMVQALVSVILITMG